MPIIAKIQVIIDLNEYAKQRDWNFEICEVSTVEEAFEVILQKVGGLP